MIEIGRPIDDTRGLRKKCVCGRFNVRRSFHGSELEWYTVPKGTTRSPTPYRTSRPHPDGLCHRCAEFGEPDYTGINIIGGKRQDHMRRSEFYYNQVRLGKLGLNLNDRRKLK